MIIKGEVKSVGVKKKLDNNDREIMTVDIRVEIKEGTHYAQELIDLPGTNASVTIEAVQLSFDTSHGPDEEDEEKV